MKVLVTGGAGYIGSATVHELRELGHEVWVFDNLENGYRQAIHKDVFFFRGDLRSYTDIIRCLNGFKPDAIIHFAAYAYVGESMGIPLDYYENNVTGTHNLLVAITKTPSVKKIIFSSSCATYGTPDVLPITEDMPQLPENPYGETKLACERMIKWVCDTVPDLTYTFLRYFNAAGGMPEVGHGEQHDPETHIIPLILDVALGKREKICVFGDDYDTPDGSCIRDYIHIKDLAAAHVLALGDHNCDFYNLGTGVGYSVLDVIEMVADVTGEYIPYEIKERRPGDPDALYADNHKAVSTLGWVPKHSDLENIIRTAWEWHRNGKKFLR